eukprot:Rmarinus@m.4076
MLCDSRFEDIKSCVLQYIETGAHRYIPAVTHEIAENFNVMTLYGREHPGMLADSVKVLSDEAGLIVKCAGEVACEDLACYFFCTTSKQATAITDTNRQQFVQKQLIAQVEARERYTASRGDVAGDDDEEGYVDSPAVESGTPSVMIDNSHADYTIIAVKCEDAPSLLLKMAKCISRFPAVYISCATTTWRDRFVYDVFHLKMRAPEEPVSAAARGPEHTPTRRRRASAVCGRIRSRALLKTLRERVMETVRLASETPSQCVDSGKGLRTRVTVSADSRVLQGATSCFRDLGCHISSMKRITRHVDPGFVSSEFVLVPSGLSSDTPSKPLPSPVLRSSGPAITRKLNLPPSSRGADSQTSKGVDERVPSPEPPAVEEARIHSPQERNHSRKEGLCSPEALCVEVARRLTRTFVDTRPDVDILEGTSRPPRE